MHTRDLALIALTAGVLLGTPAAATAAPQQDAPSQQADSTRADTLPKFILNPLNITALRTPRRIFSTAAPVSVVDSLTIRNERPTTAAEAIRDLPGVDINGVGPNQQRPTIRGQRGQRILLLEDGLRLNNARRQADFGELPAIVDISRVDRIEVVRGPASVLYGSDAIGGVVNLITGEAPPADMGDVFGGRATFSYRTAGEQLWPSADVWGRSGKVGFRASASYRDAQDYESASGTFGDITLQNDATVFGTGVRDSNFSLFLDYQLGDRQKVYAEVDRYRAEDAGFGFVRPEDIGDEDGLAIDIKYPEQTVTKLKTGFRAADVDLPVADRVDASVFYLDNERNFDFDVFIPFGAPGTGLTSEQRNFTDLETIGLRLEAAKLLFGRHLLTYGIDYYHDDSNNTDLVTTTVVPFPGAPPSTEVDDTPTVPYATYDKLGVFAQTEFELGERAAVILGGRWQTFGATPQPTPGLDELPGDARESTVVAAANGLVEVAPNLNLVGSVGRGFRAPNLIELFFNGAVPEGNGFQVSNPELKPETSWNVDAGFKYRRSDVAFEAYYFRTWLNDGIRIAATGDSVGPFPAFQNVNVESLTLQGVELVARYQILDPLEIGGTFTWIDGTDNTEDNSENNPLSDTYSSRFTGELTYRPPSGRWWAEYQVRHQGAQRDADFVIGTPVGNELPAFTVMNLRGGIELFDFGATTNGLVLGIENLTDELYAEFANATFFRPAPGRTLLLSWTTRF